MSSSGRLSALTALALALAAPSTARADISTDHDDVMIVLNKPMNAYIKAYIVQDACNSRIAEDEDSLGEEVLNLLGAINDDFCEAIGGALIRRPGERLDRLKRKRDRLKHRYADADTPRKKDAIKRRVINVSGRTLNLENTIRYHSGMDTIDRETLVFIAGPGRSETVVINAEPVAGEEG